MNRFRLCSVPCPPSTNCCRNNLQKPRGEMKKKKRSRLQSKLAVAALTERHRRHISRFLNQCARRIRVQIDRIDGFPLIVGHDRFMCERIVRQPMHIELQHLDMFLVVAAKRLMLQHDKSIPDAHQQHSTLWRVAASDAIARNLHALGARARVRIVRGQQTNVAALMFLAAIRTDAMDCRMIDVHICKR